MEFPTVGQTRGLEGFVLRLSRAELEGSCEQGHHGMVDPPGYGARA